MAQSQPKQQPRDVALRAMPNTRAARCHGCRSPIQWATTAAGRKIALEVDATIESRDDGFYVSSDDVHWAHCPEREQFRRDRASGTSPRIRELEKTVQALRAEVRDSVPRKLLEDQRQRGAALAAAVEMVIEKCKTAEGTRTVIVQMLGQALHEHARTTTDAYKGSGRYKGD